MLVIWPRAISPISCSTSSLRSSLECPQANNNKEIAMTDFNSKLQEAKALYQGAQDKLDVLRNIDPFFIDLSLRENPVGARVGQTIGDKKAILPLVQQFGFMNILLGTLDYSMPEELEVDDDFMMWLRDSGADMTGCYVFTAIGIENEQ